jgi:hypothetical protein
MANLVDAIVFTVLSYVANSLRKENAAMEKAFAPQNTPAHMAARDQRLLIATEGNPKKSLYNILNW